MTKRSKNKRENQRIKDQMRSKRIAPDRTVASNPSRRRKNRGRIRQVSIEELQEEYSYVLKDLRRIFVLALIMFALLVVANIVYPLVVG